jgi:phosphatidylinositol alpha-1,6-mannosyltransferase
VSTKSLLLTEVFPPQVGGSGRWFWELYRRLPRGNL